MKSGEKPPSGARPSEARPPETNQRATALEKPLIARLQESDVMRTLGGILASGGTADVTRMDWPTLRMGLPLTTFLSAMREMRASLIKRAAAGTVPVVAVIGAEASGDDRSIAALNIALAAARDGAKVLMIDADYARQALSKRIRHDKNSEPAPSSPLNWLGVGAKVSYAKAFYAKTSHATTSLAIETANGISVLPVAKGSDAEASDAICRAILDAQAAGRYDLVVLDGPATPWNANEHKLLDAATGFVAVLPAALDINECLEELIAALGGSERKLAGVVISELHPAPVYRQPEKQYA